MKTIVHAANTRGGSDHGWLKSKHTLASLIITTLNVWDLVLYGLSMMTLLMGGWALAITHTPIWKSSASRYQEN